MAAIVPTVVVFSATLKASALVMTGAALATVTESIGSRKRLGLPLAGTKFTWASPSNSPVVVKGMVTKGDGDGSGTFKGLKAI